MSANPFERPVASKFADLNGDNRPDIAETARSDARGADLGHDLRESFAAISALT